MPRPFVDREAERLGFGGLVSGPGAFALREAIKNLGPDTLRSVLDRIVGDNWKETPPGDPSGPAAAAHHEPAWRERRVDLVVTGHTHLAEQVPLGRTRTGDDGFYLNTGTWRTMIPRGVDDAFARLRTYSMVFCYSDREREARRGDGRSFESWTSRLSAAEGHGGYGPYEDDLGPARPPSHELAFRRLVVHHVDEGDGFLGSAELRLRFGVDHEMRLLHRDGVRAGDRIDLAHVPETLLTPSLDGELWFHGVEKDHGDSIFDMDDPLPWALDRLARVSTERDAGFRPGAGVLSIRGRAGTRLELEYEVRAI